MELLVTWHPPRMAQRNNTSDDQRCRWSTPSWTWRISANSWQKGPRSRPDGCPQDVPGKWSCHEGLENHVLPVILCYPSLMCFEVNSEVFEHSWNISWVPQWFLRQKTKIEGYKMLDSLLDNKQPMHRNSGLGKKVFIFCYYFHCVSF
jgi:hypothetical protein